MLRDFTTSVLAPAVAQQSIDAVFDESIVDGLGSWASSGYA